LLDEWTLRRKRARRCPVSTRFGAPAGGDPDPFVAAGISPCADIEVQSALQKYVDHVITKTFDVPGDLTFPEFQSPYLTARNTGLKQCARLRFSRVWLDIPLSGRGSIECDTDREFHHPFNQRKETMSAPKIGNKVSDIKMALTGDQSTKLSELRGKNLVLYFYPKDNTPGCTLEGQDFRDNYLKFKRRNTIVLGVSRDSIGSHEKFREKHNFPFDLVSDPDEKLCRKFDVIREKNMYGKKVMGIERSTFVIDADGVLRAEFRKVKVKGHVDDVLEEIKKLK
jgi:peroxiredoxin Q/BCP